MVGNPAFNRFMAEWKDQLDGIRTVNTLTGRLVEEKTEMIGKPATFYGMVVAAMDVYCRVFVLVVRLAL